MQGPLPTVPEALVPGPEPGPQPALHIQAQVNNSNNKKSNNV